MDYANTTNVEFIVDPKVLFHGWWIYSYYALIPFICLLVSYFTLVVILCFTGQDHSNTYVKILKVGKELEVLSRLLVGSVRAGDCRRVELCYAPENSFYILVKQI